MEQGGDRREKMGSCVHSMGLKVRAVESDCTGLSLSSITY